MLCATLCAVYDFIAHTFAMPRFYAGGGSEVQSSKIAGQGLHERPDGTMKPLRVQRYEEILIYARGNEKLPQICAKNDQI